MIRVLVDHNIEGQALMIWGALSAEGWVELIPLQMLTFFQAGLSEASSDRRAWRFAQQQEMVLLTANRRMKGEHSLEETIRQENRPDSLPVVTIANANRVMEAAYRERCAIRLLEVVLDLKDYLGAGRIYIP